MVQSYLKYEKLSSFGGICGSNGNVVFDYDSGLLLTPFNEEIILWNPKTQIIESVFCLDDLKSQVSFICKMSRSSFGAGFEDGTICIFNLNDKDSNVLFKGHKSAVTCMVFDEDSNTIFSGSKDSIIIAWDVANECGLFRLKGHKNMITDLCFIDDIKGQSYLISSSKDGLLKIWDLSLKACVDTVVDHAAEVSRIVYVKEKGLVITGSVDSEIRLFKLKQENEETDAEEDAHRLLSLHGSILRKSTSRIVGFSVSRPFPGEIVLGLASSDKSFELLRFLKSEELEKKLSRKKKRLREKGKMDVDEEPQLSDLESVYSYFCDYKIGSFTFGKCNTSKKCIEVIFGLKDNSLEFASAEFMDEKKKSFKMVKKSTIGRRGHRHDPTFVCISDDDTLLASASSDSLKLWNASSGELVRSFKCDNAISGIFSPDGNCLIVGLKSGLLHIYDVTSARLLEVVEAHDGSVRTLAIRPDKRGFASGGSDKKVHFWDFEWNDGNVDENGDDMKSTSSLSVALMRTFEVSDEVLFVKYSPDQKLIGVALIDSTIKLFYHDTLKLYLTLFGHKLPVTSFDISSDNLMLISSSADKSIKVWGLDFGDCRKSLSGHTESVKMVCFIANTHYFISISRDKSIRYWDGDKFELISVVGHHLGEISGMCMSRFGGFFVTCSQDKSLKVWNRTDEQIFIEEEREKELENIFFASDEKKDNEDEDELGDAIVAASTKESKIVGEKISDAISIADNERNALIAGKIEKTANPYILVYGEDTTPDLYLLREFEKVKANNLESALLMLSFKELKTVLQFLCIWSEKNWNISIVSRVARFILLSCKSEIFADADARKYISDLSSSFDQNFLSLSEMYGIGLIAIGKVKSEWEDEHNMKFFDESSLSATNKVDSKGIKRKHI